MNNDDALKLIFTRNAFYRRLHFLVLGAFALCLVIIALLLSIIFYLYKHPIPALYFAADEDGRLIHLLPLDVPNQPIDVVNNWVMEAVQKAYSFDYVNYPRQMQSVEKYFTPDGWSSFTSQLTASNNLLLVRDRKAVVIAQVVDQPKIVMQGIYKGAYSWKMEMPVLVTTRTPPYDDKSQFVDAFKVTVIVQQQEALQSFKGLGIVQMIAEIQTSTSSQPQDISGTSSTGS